ncbi:hypothetical protein SAMN04488239_111112 [Ruegeria marina]|uniref:Uncharacterized protein n=1 Tax=Ruegeria marina TaxID=639004 RepID=A0A1G6YD81_9RHOB|nr:hypothetical protein SAMN04488239_111112 [Ruegeria marina]
MADTDPAPAEPPSRGRLPLRGLRKGRSISPSTPAKVIPAEMDSRATGHYVLVMFARAIILLALLAVVLLTTVAPSHAASMSAEAKHAFHADVMIHMEAGDAHDCAGEAACGEADAGLCVFVCAGLTAFAPVPVAEAARSADPSRHQFPSGTSVESRSPDLNERPPASRLRPERSILTGAQQRSSVSPGPAARGWYSIPGSGSGST